MDTRAAVENSPPSVWIGTRLALLVSAAIVGPQVAPWYAKANLRHVATSLAVMVAIGFLMALSVTAFTRLGMRPGERWLRPSWRGRLYPVSPAATFHFFGWYLVVLGLSAGVAVLWVPKSSLLGGSTLGGCGLGFLAAAHASVRVFPRAFKG